MKAFEPILLVEHVQAAVVDFHVSQEPFVASCWTCCTGAASGARHPAVTGLYRPERGLGHRAARGGLLDYCVPTRPLAAEGRLTLNT